LPKPLSFAPITNLIRGNVVRLIRQPLDIYLLLPLHQLNDPDDPEVVCQDLDDLSDIALAPARSLRLYLQGRRSLQDLVKACY
jgi:hypothetical protein